MLFNERTLDGAKWAEGEPRKNVFVFIGRDLDKECLGPAQSTVEGGRKKGKRHQLVAVQRVTSVRRSFFFYPAGKGIADKTNTTASKSL